MSICHKNSSARDLEVENVETRPTIGRDDTDDKGDIVKIFYENLVEYSVEDAKSSGEYTVPDTEGKSEPMKYSEQDAKVVSDNLLNIEVHIPNLVSLSSDIVFCSGFTKARGPCKNKRRLAKGQNTVYCHHHLAQAPASTLF